MKHRKRNLIDAVLRRYARDCKRNGNIYEQPNGHRTGRTEITLVNTYRPVATYAYAFDSHGRVRLPEVQS